MSLFPHRFVIANDVFKFKEFNLDSKQCRKTSLAPRFGNPPSLLLPIPPPPVQQSSAFLAYNSNNNQQQEGGEGEFGGEEGEEALPPPPAPVPAYFAFSTASRVIGISTFPLTGDPSQTMGIVAHPGEVTSVDVSHDGRYLFSAGGFDLSVNMWRIDVEAHELSKKKDKAAAEEAAAAAIAAAMSGKASNAFTNSSSTNSSLQPYFSLLEGGEGGELHRDIVDYFYYCQLRHLGEDSMEKRNLTGEIPLEEIPSLFRSVGFYPSEDEVANIVNEVRYKSFVNTGETQEYVGLVRE